MTLKKSAGGMLASFVLGGIAAWLAVLPALLLSDMGWCPLTGLENTVWFTLLYARLEDWVLYSQLCSTVFVLLSGLSAATAWLFARRYTSNGLSAMLAALLYSFGGGLLVLGGSGWLAFGAVLPLLLWGMDCLYLDGRKGCLALGVGLTLWTMSEQLLLLPWLVLLTAVYFCFRLTVYPFKAARFAFALLEWLTGLALAGMLVLPFGLELWSLRLEGGIWSAFSQLALYGGNPIAFAQKLLLPPILEARQGLGSFSLWVPILGWSGCFALLGCKKHPLRGAAVFSLLCILVLLAGNIAGILPQTWGGLLLLPLLIAAVCAASAFDGDSRILQRGYAVMMFLTALLCIFCGGGYALGWLETNPQRLAWLLGGAVLSCAVGILLVCFQQRKPMALMLTWVFCLCCAGVSFGQSWRLLPQVTEYSPYTASSVNSYLDGDKSRMELPRGFAWLADYWEQPAFALNGEETDLAFRRALNNLGGYDTTDNFALRSLLSVRWKFVPQGSAVNLTGYEYYGDFGSWKVYQNLYSLPYGVMYEYYLPQAEFEQASAEERARLTLKGLVLSDKDYETVKHLLSVLPTEKAGKLSDTDTLTDCYHLAQGKVSGYEPSADGFTAYTAFERPGVVFFSQPYRSGMKCTVDGEDTPVLQANGGFIAVPVPAGEWEIVVQNAPEGEVSGKHLSMAGAVALLALLLLNLGGRKKSMPAAEQGATLRQRGNPKANESKQQGTVSELMSIPTEALEVPDDLLGEPLIVPPTVAEALEKEQAEDNAQVLEAPAAKEEPAPVRQESFAELPPKTQPSAAKRSERKMSVEEMQAEIFRRKREQQAELDRLKNQK